VGGIAGILLVVFSMFAGFLVGAYGIARDIGEKIECHAFQLVADTILARGGPGATTVEDLGEQDLCHSPYSMAQAMCQDLLDLEVCNPKQLAAKLCSDVEPCQAAADWFTDTKTAITAWLQSTLKAPATWLMDHAKLAWNSVQAAVQGTNAALDGDTSPDASAVDESEAGAELDSEIVEAEGGGDPGAAPNPGVPGLDTPESDGDLGAGEADCGSSCTAEQLADDSAAARDQTVADVVEETAETAEKTGAIAGALKVVGSAAGLGLKVAGWVGVAYMAYQLVSQLIQGYQVSAQTQAAGFHDYSPEDLWYPNYPSCADAYDTWAEVLQDPTSLANLEFTGEIGGNNDPEAQISSYTDELFVINAFLNAATGGLVQATSDDITFLPPQTMSLYEMYEQAVQGVVASDPDCPDPTKRASAADQAAITAAYVRDLDIGGYDGQWLLAHPQSITTQDIAEQAVWCYPAGYATVADLHAVDVADGDWGHLADDLSSRATCPAGPTEADAQASAPGLFQPPAAYTELLGDLRAGDDGPYDQLLSEATQVAQSGDSASAPDGLGTLSQEAAQAEQALEQIAETAKDPVTPPASEDAGSAAPMSEDDAIALLLAASDVLGSGDPSQVATSYIDTASTANGDSGTPAGGVGGNVGATALLPTEMVTGYAQADPGATLNPTDPSDQYLATAAVLADDLTSSGGDLNQAYARYVAANHLPPYAGSWAGGYPTDPSQAPSDIDHGSELNAGDWGLEAGAYQGSPPEVPTAYLLTTAAADWEGYLDSDDLGNDPVTPPADVLDGQPVPAPNLLTVFEDAAQTYDTNLALLLAVSAQQSAFTAQCEPIGAGGEGGQAGGGGADFGVMGMVGSAFTDSGPPAGVDMAAAAVDADGDPLTLAGQTWTRGESLPSDGACPMDGEPAGMLDPTAEVDVAAYLLSGMGATPSAGPDQLGTALTSYYLVAVIGLPTPSESGAAAAATSWVQSVLLVRYSAYAAWLSGGAAQVGSAACSGPIGTICPEPATPVFPWVPSGGYPDAFPFGQCTWWAAYNSWAISEYGVGGDADGPGSDSWISSAESRMPPGSVQLAAQGGVPAVGEVVVYWPGGSYDATDGHVAVVVAVDPDPAASSGISGYWVSEANFTGLGQVDERHIAWPDPQVRGFILASPQEVAA
jgi:hypothetical protein